MSRHFLLAFILLVLFFVVPIIIMSFVFQSENIWSGLTLGVAGTYEEFCERNRMEAFLRERMNSWSNLGFVWFGLVAILDGLLPDKLNSKNNIIARYPILSIFTGLSFLYLGVGSFLYHAALTKFTQLLDVAGTYAAMASVICLGILTLIYPYIKEKRQHTKIAVIIFLVLTIFADYLLYIYKWEISSSVVLPIMIGILVIIASLIQFSKKMNSNGALVILGFIAVGAAYYIWTLDVKKIFCNPDSILQGHAIWHLLTGLSLFLMYQYFSSVTLIESNPYK